MSGLSDIYSLVLGLNDQPGWLLHLDILAPGGILALSDNNEYCGLVSLSLSISSSFGSLLSEQMTILSRMFRSKRLQDSPCRSLTYGAEPCPTTSSIRPRKRIFTRMVRTTKGYSGPALSSSRTLRHCLSQSLSRPLALMPVHKLPITRTQQLSRFLIPSLNSLRTVSPSLSQVMSANSDRCCGSVEKPTGPLILPCQPISQLNMQARFCRMESQ